MGILTRLLFGRFLYPHPDNPGIYRIRNRRNGMAYAGSTIRSMSRRWFEHRSDLNQGTHANAALQHDWDHYGSQAFAFETLEIVTDESLIAERETYWFARYRATGKCYNVVAPQQRKPRRHRRDSPLFIPSDIDRENLSPEECFRMIVLTTDESRQFRFSADKLEKLFAKDFPNVSALIAKMRKNYVPEYP